MSETKIKNIREVTHREFVVTWMTSETLEDAASALGAATKQAQNRAAYLRTIGVKLPKKTRRMTDRQLEVAQLNSLIKKYSKQ